MFTARASQGSNPAQWLSTPSASSVLGSMHLHVPFSTFDPQVTPARSLVDVGIAATYPLTSLQQGMLFHSLYTPHSGVDIEQLVCNLREPLNVECFMAAWEHAIERHPILRTSLSWNPHNEPIQNVHSVVQLPFHQHDWTLLTEAEQADRLNEYLQHDRREGFELSQTADSIPPIRFALFQHHEAEYTFVWTFHHILLDGRSFVSILKEVFHAYDALQKGFTIAWDATPTPFQTYVEWQQQQDWSRSQSYWKTQLKGFSTPTPLLNVPIAPQHQQSGHGAAQLRLSTDLTQQLQTFAQTHDITANTIVQAAWALLLSRYSGESDIVFGATRACRHASVEHAESIVGLLINTLPVRVPVKPDQPLLPWLQDLRSQHLAIRPHEHTPLTQVQAWSEVPRGVSLFDSLVMFENYELNAHLKQQGGGWLNRDVECNEQPSFPLVLMGYLGEQLLLKLSYDRQRFDANTIERMLGHLQMLITRLVANPDQRLGDLTLITNAERHQVLVEWNDTDRDYPRDQCLHQLIEAQAEKTPDAIALVYQHQTRTYQQVNEQANQIAHYLRSIGIQAGDFVAVYMNRGLEMIPALLGILKAGAAYVPLEPSFPAARVQWILDSLSISCVLTQPSHQAMFQQIQPNLPALKQVIALDTARPHVAIAAQSSANLPLHNTSNDNAYVIFTSGSTGTPKGVVVRHQPVINLIEWVNRTFEVSARDRVLFITSLCFDLSVYDIFGLLAAGGSIHIASSEDVRDPQVLINLLKTEPITFWDSAPPALQQLAPFFSALQGESTALRLVFMSGDWIPVTLPTALQDTFPGVEVISLGGATEATVWSNFYRIDKVESHWASIPYGKPIQNAQYYILDEQFNPCPIGVTGELYIGGDCLASGYTDPVKTAERFLPHPHSRDPKARIYRTGDLARFFPDGNIEFLGRIDHQVKIRGFRIELGEIEGVLAQHPIVRESVVMAREDQPGDKRLVAYVVPRSSVEVKTLRQFLREHLPEYMVPSAIVLLDAIPLTQNGKVDRRALPMPVGNKPQSTDTIVLSQDILERQLSVIWEKVLDVEVIQSTDNFFDLGGHSLLAVKVMHQVEKAFGISLPIAALFQAPTIEQFAQLLRDGRDVEPWSLIEVNPIDGQHPPLFWCQYYIEIADQLRDQPMYGMDSGYQEVKNPATHIQEWATGYVNKIRAIQPHGPYFLGAYCFGGYVALEVAQQLQAQGQEVALLALVETYGPDIPYYQKRMSLFDGLVVLSSARKRIEAWRLKRIRRKLISHKPTILFTPPEEEPIREAVRHYKVKPYAGRVVLFSGHVSSLRSRLMPRAGWGDRFTGEFKTEIVQGDHYNLFEPGNVEGLAARVKACYEEVVASLNL